MKIFTESDFGSRQTKLWVLKENGERKFNVNYDSASGFMKLTELTDENVGEAREPFLKIPTDMFNELVKTFVEYASKKGVKTINENLLTGKLSATEKHLDDMRNITFKLLK